MLRPWSGSSPIVRAILASSSRSRTGVTACFASAAAKLAPLGRPPRLRLLPATHQLGLRATKQPRSSRASASGEPLLADVSVAQISLIVRSASSAQSGNTDRQI